MEEFKIIRGSTPNKMNRQGWIPDLIVSHITEGNFDGAVSWLSSPRSKASSHFVVAQDGRITQLVDIKEAAWINGTDTDPSKGNFYGNSLLKTVRERKTNANYYSVGIEHEGILNKTGGKLTDKQLKASIWLHRHIISEIKKIYETDIILDREHIVGHYQVDPIRKPFCPGKLFQFDEIIVALKKEEEETMKLDHEWQWNMLYTTVESLEKKGILTSTEWKEKVKNRTLTVSEVAWLNMIVLDRLFNEEVLK